VDEIYMTLDGDPLEAREDADEPLETSEDADGSAGVVRSYLVIAGLYTLSASLIWGVNTLFMLDAGLNIF